jgi:hypothetical protein
VLVLQPLVVDVGPVPAALSSNEPDAGAGCSGRVVETTIASYRPIHHDHVYAGVPIVPVLLWQTIKFVAIHSASAACSRCSLVADPLAGLDSPQPGWTASSQSGME